MRLERDKNFFYDLTAQGRRFFDDRARRKIRVRARLPKYATGNLFPVTRPFTAGRVGFPVISFFRFITATLYRRGFQSVSRFASRLRRPEAAKTVTYLRTYFVHNIVTFYTPVRFLLYRQHVHTCAKRTTRERSFDCPRWIVKLMIFFRTIVHSRVKSPNRTRVSIRSFKMENSSPYKSERKNRYPTRFFFFFCAQCVWSVYATPEALTSILY